MTKPTTIDEYIATCPANVQPILEHIRQIVREVAPEAQERISYQMPAFYLDGYFFYYGAFKKHIGIYPPLSGDEPWQQALAPYRGEKGNLKFPLHEPIPYDLIRQVAEAQLKEHRAKRTAR